MRANPTTIFVTFLPSILIILLSVLSFSEVTANIKGLFILSLLLIFPILFVLQGVACALGKGSLVVSLLFSTITFIVILIIYLNSSALIYIFIYIVSGLIGYGIIKLFQKNK
ncbi:hypothetical protein [Alkalihalobacterium elongatum]|uniref:hypothetical protein n=1 Tax=Alkalihalobacterium elongatum TaxID=2675466 RepID=UPI001C1F8C09|nr:hypothetical protein [Alkalihalobacterium elongatum]